MRARSVMLMAALAIAGCKREAPPAPPPAKPAAPPADVSVPASGDEKVEPVYQAADVIDPGAKRLCDVLDDLPNRRLAECCSQKPSMNMAEQCARILSTALKLGALHLDAPSVDRCVADVTAQYQGCGWLSVIRPPVPDSCKGSVVGTLAAGQKCRSTLECSGNLRCLGAGPTDMGVCSAPRAAGGSCLTGVDALDAYLTLGVDVSHPECTGYCDHHRCMAFHDVGTACTLTPQCGPSAYCAEDKKVCVAGPSVAKEGERCQGRRCEGSLRCIEGSCQKPRADGQKCHNFEDCQGVCAKERGADEGVCQPMCPTSRQH